MDSTSRNNISMDWKELYRAALFESNKSKIPVRVAQAERRVAERARELFNSGCHDTLERSELNVAMYALVALRSSLSWGQNSRNVA